MCMSSLPPIYYRKPCNNIFNNISNITSDYNYDYYYNYDNCSETDGNDSAAWNQPELDAHNNIHTIPYNATTNYMIDVSKYNFPNELYYMIPEWEVAVKTITFIPIILFGMLGNIMLLNIIIQNRALRTPTNLLIGNLAAADLATLTICPIMFMFHDFFQNYMLGAVGCKLEGFLEGAILVTAVLNLCAVSYDRLTAIVLPQETRLTIRGAKIVMLSTWVAGFLIATPLAIYRTYKERQWKNFLETYCSENTSILPMYWHVLISALVWFPLTVMVICYSAIFYKLDRYEQNILKREHPISVSYKKKVAKTLFIVLLTFILLRLPFTALVFIRNQMLKNSVMNQIDKSFHILWYTSHYLIFLNAAVNPLIYGLTNDNFRRAYHQTTLLRCLNSKRASKIDKQKINNNLNNKNNNNSKGNNNVRHDKLQPRGPCGDDKLANTSFWMIFQNQRNKLANALNNSKTGITTKTTNVTPTSSVNYNINNNNNNNTQKIEDSGVQSDVVVKSDGFI